MYGIFTNSTLKITQMQVNIPYMEHIAIVSTTFQHWLSSRVLKNSFHKGDQDGREMRTTRRVKSGSYDQGLSWSSIKMLNGDCGFLKGENISLQEIGI
jgi:hypothetical protein